MNYETYEVKVYYNGYKHWFQNGKRHRADGPAIENADGYKAWYQNGRLHRANGPAVEYPGGTKRWYLEGEKYSEKEWLKLTTSCQGQMVEADGVKYRLEKI